MNIAKTLEQAQKFVNYVFRNVIKISDDKNIKSKIIKLSIFLYWIKKYVYNDDINRMEKDWDKILNTIKEIIKKDKSIIENIKKNKEILHYHFVSLNGYLFDKFSEFTQEDFEKVLHVYNLLMINDSIKTALKERQINDIYDTNLSIFTKNLKKLDTNDIIEFLEIFFNSYIKNLKELDLNEYLNEHDSILFIKLMIIECIRILFNWLDLRDDKIIEFIKYTDNKEFLDEVEHFIKMLYITRLIIDNSNKIVNSNVFDTGSIINYFFSLFDKYSLGEVLENDFILDYVYDYIIELCSYEIRIPDDMTSKSGIFYIRLIINIIFLFLNPFLLKFIKFFANKKKKSYKEVIKDIIIKSLFIYYDEIDSNIIKIDIGELKNNEHEIEGLLNMIINLIEIFEDLKNILNSGQDTRFYDDKLGNKLFNIINIYKNLVLFNMMLELTPISISNLILDDIRDIRDEDPWNQYILYIEQLQCIFDSTNDNDILKLLISLFNACRGLMNNSSVLVCN